MEAHCHCPAAVVFHTGDVDEFRTRFDEGERAHVLVQSDDIFDIDFIKAWRPNWL